MAKKKGSGGRKRPPRQNVFEKAFRRKMNELRRKIAQMRRFEDPDYHIYLEPATDALENQKDLLELLHRAHTAMRMLLGTLITQGERSDRSPGELRRAKNALTEAEQYYKDAEVLFLRALHESLESHRAIRTAFGEKE